MAARFGRRLISSSPVIRRQSLIAGLLALLLFIAGVYAQAPIGFDSRFVLFAQEMLRNGPTVFPTSYGQPYADYSSLSTLFIWLLSLALGAVNSLTAWLPKRNRRGIDRHADVSTAGALFATLGAGQYCLADAHCDLRQRSAGGVAGSDAGRSGVCGVLSWATRMIISVPVGGCR
jgi:hypothetical protein